MQLVDFVLSYVMKVRNHNSRKTTERLKKQPKQPKKKKKKRKKKKKKNKKKNKKMKKKKKKKRKKKKNTPPLSSGSRKKAVRQTPNRRKCSVIQTVKVSSEAELHL